MKLSRIIALVTLFAVLPAQQAFAKPQKPTSSKTTSKKKHARKKTPPKPPPDAADDDTNGSSTTSATPGTDKTPTSKPANGSSNGDAFDTGDDSTLNASDDAPPPPPARGEEADEPAPRDETKSQPAAATWAFGPYVRYTVVPAFMLKLFVDIAPTATAPAFGVSARYRPKADGPTIDFGIGYASYAFTGAFRTKGGDLNDTEWIESSLGLLHLTGSVLWDAPISNQFAFEYGVGLDFGIVTGQFKRTEAFANASGQFQKCPYIQAGSLCGPPLTGSATTDPYTVKGEQYNVVDKRVPPVMGLPMLPRLGLRYAPIPALAVRLEGAYGIAQLWLGLSAAYVPGH